MVKNAQVHLVLESSKLKELKDKSIDLGISLNSYCLSRIFSNSQLDRIEYQLKKLLDKNEKE
jgi:hypothetical protein